MHICTCMHTHVCIYLCMYACMYMHINLFIIFVPHKLFLSWYTHRWQYNKQQMVYVCPWTMYGVDVLKIITSNYTISLYYHCLRGNCYSGLGDSMICAREMVIHKAILYSYHPLYSSFYGLCSQLWGLRIPHCDA